MLWHDYKAILAPLALLLGFAIGAMVAIGFM